MKENIIRIKVLILFLIVSFIFSFMYGVSYGVDKSVYYGLWETRSPSISISLSILNEKEVLLEIDNQRIKNVKVDFLYGDSAIYPFLYLYSNRSIDSKNSKFFMEDQYLYLVIGTDGEETSKSKFVLRGYYVNSKVRDDHYGSEKVISYPIELYEQPGK